jgi:hypothetical protein
LSRVKNGAALNSNHIIKDMKLNIIKPFLLGTLAIGLYTGCKPENFENGNGLTDPNFTAAFSVSPVAGKENTFALQATETGVLGIKWDMGDGSGPRNGRAIDTAFFPDAGKYTITLTTIGKGGISQSASQDVTVANSDPKAGNLLSGAKMQPGDETYWKPLQISSGVTFTMKEGKMVATGGNGGHAAVYQAVDIVAGQKYKVDMSISGSGATDTWFEVYADTKAPVAGQDYSSENKLLSLNTWGGCGNSPFSGLLSAISCSGNGNSISFPASGRIYLVIKSGGANLGTTGISFTNVSFRGTN